MEVEPERLAGPAWKAVGTCKGMGFECSDFRHVAGDHVVLAASRELTAAAIRRATSGRAA